MSCIHLYDFAGKYWHILTYWDNESWKWCVWNGARLAQSISKLFVENGHVKETYIHTLGHKHTNQHQPTSFFVFFLYSVFIFPDHFTPLNRILWYISWFSPFVHFPAVVTDRGFLENPPWTIFAKSPWIFMARPGFPKDPRWSQWEE